MSEIYSTGKICPFNKQNCDLQKEGLSLEPGKYMFNNIYLSELNL